MLISFEVFRNFYILGLIENIIIFIIEFTSKFQN